MDRLKTIGRIEDVDEAVQRFRTLSTWPHELEKDHANTFLELSQCHILLYEFFEQQYDLGKAQVAIARTDIFKTIPASMRAECLRTLVRFPMHDTTVLIR